MVETKRKAGRTGRNQNDANFFCQTLSLRKACACELARLSVCGGVGARTHNEETNQNVICAVRELQTVTGRAVCLLQPDSERQSCLFASGWQHVDSRHAVLANLAP